MSDHEQDVGKEHEASACDEDRPVVRDASTQYDLSHIVHPEEHSYCLTSSPIPLSASRVLFPPSPSLCYVTPATEIASCVESEEELPHDSILVDPDYDQPCDTSIEDVSFASTQSDTLVPPETDSKYIVFNSCLQKLLRFCPTCGSVVESMSEHTQGTMLTVKLVCSNKHSIIWHSQPLINDMPAGNLVASAAILLSGGSYTKFSQFADIMKLQFMSESTFYRIQDSALIPVVNDTCNKHQTSLLQQFKVAPVCLLGDGRCDSPGYSAKYGTYTHLEQNTGLILDFQLVQVGEVKNSVAMEREGFERSIQKLKSEGLTITQIATDRHPQITATIRKKYPDIRHQYDVWHVSKGVAKKLTKKGKAKACSKLLPWIQSISNHLWWSSESCNENAQILKEKWTSVVHHTVNVHSWEGAHAFVKCEHPSLTPEECRKKEWLKAGSLAHEALKSVVLNKKLLTDIKKMTQFCHTGNLEVYHSLLTKYCPKRQHFGYNCMLARIQLAALDHNHNVDREQATTASGSKQYKVVYPKATKKWVAKPIAEPKKYNYLQEIVSSVIQKRLAETQPLSKHKAQCPPVSLPMNISGCEKPPKEEVISKTRSRFR